ncbi:hypothetical protein AB9Q04_06430 [Anaerococcus sp. ENR1011]|uniref:DUF5050 domain-containing protein n=1 Tax=Anaerococcus groningensis TaxID=3115616 RepID=A0ABW9N1H3_9FIRM
MKKFVPIMALSLALVGCNNTDAPANEVSPQEKVETNEDNDSTQVIDVKKAEDNKENSEEAENTDSKEVEQTEDSENDQKEEDEEKTEEETEDKEVSDEEVTKDDLFFNPLGPFSSVDENGVLVDENGNEITIDNTDHYDYVKYTNNVFVKSKSDIYDQVLIVRMNDKSVETLFEFPGVDDFRPLGMIGDRIYGFHDQQSKAEINGTPTLDTEKSAIAYVDLATGEVHDFEATVDVMTGGAVVVDGELQFTKPGDNNEQDAYNYDLYKLDLSKGTDQEAELVEKNFDLQYLFGQKRFENGNPVWKIYRADNDNIYANDQKFPFLWAEQGMQEIIGNNIFYYEFSDSEDKLSTPIKVINMTSGETVLDTQIRGMKIADGKLYYLTTDNELESVDIEL